jgi:Lrp/AsnC family transcriptional regulator of ectoine degradation
MGRLSSGKLGQPPLRPSERNTRMKKLGLDATDIRILSAVQQHGQLSKARLAELVNLSPTPCWARLDRLKTAGYIRGYHAELALERIVDFTQVVVTVSLGSHRKAEFDRFEGYIRNLDEVTDCIATGGGVDYVMKTATPSLAAFQALIDEMLSSDLAIDRYMIYIATRQVKTSQPNLTRLIAKSQK